MVRSVSEEFADARAHERVLSLQIEHQNQIRKALEQMLPELFLAMQLLLESVLLCDIDQRSLVTDQTSCLQHPGRGIDAYGDAAIFSAQPNFSRASAATLATTASQRRLAAGINAELLRRQPQ